MCGESKANKNKSAGAKYDNPERKSWAKQHGVGMYGDPSKPTSSTNNPNATSAQRDKGFAQGIGPSDLGNSESGAGGMGGQAGDMKTTLGAPDQITPATGNPLPSLSTTKPQPSPHTTGLFGPMGAKAMQETEEAFEPGSISVPENMGWDFKKGKLTGDKHTWKPDRDIGNVRDQLAKTVGTPYDRKVTADRALTMLGKGTGTLGIATAELSKGNYEFDKKNNLKEDSIGIATDLVAPAARLALGNTSGALLSGVQAAKTLYNNHTLRERGVLAPISTPRSNPMTTDSHESEIRDNLHKLFPTIRNKPKETAKESVAARAAPKQIRRGRGSLLLTGSRGVQDKANLFFTGLLKG